MTTLPISFHTVCREVDIGIANIEDRRIRRRSDSFETLCTVEL